MILDGRRGWYWYLQSLPKKVQEYDVPVSFSIIEREIGSRFDAKSMMVDESDIAYDIMDADTLLGILFDESLKSKCIAAMEDNCRRSSINGCAIERIDVTIVLVQGVEGYTNIDADVLGCFEKVLQK
jgi:hypothetical protein